MCEYCEKIINNKNGGVCAFGRKQNTLRREACCDTEQCASG